MSADVISFAFGHAGVSIRAVKDVAGAPWFVFNDIRHVLDLSKSGRTLSRLDEADRGVCQLLTHRRGLQQFATVNEAGLYALIFRSRKPEALAFKRWVTTVVLPAIRIDGAYIRGEERLALAYATRDQLLAQLAALTATVTTALQQKASRAGLCGAEERDARHWGLRPSSRQRPFSGRFGDPE